jgi:hypothetical protein
MNSERNEDVLAQIFQSPAEHIRIVMLFDGLKDNRLLPFIDKALREAQQQKKSCTFDLLHFDGVKALSLDESTLESGLFTQMLALFRGISGNAGAKHAGGASWYEKHSLGPTHTVIFEAHNQQQKYTLNVFNDLGSYARAIDVLPDSFYEARELRAQPHRAQWEQDRLAREYRELAFLTGEHPLLPSEALHRRLSTLEKRPRSWHWYEDCWLEPHEDNLLFLGKLLNIHAHGTGTESRIERPLSFRGARPIDEFWALFQIAISGKVIQGYGHSRFDVSVGTLSITDTKYQSSGYYGPFYMVFKPGAKPDGAPGTNFGYYGIRPSEAEGDLFGMDQIEAIVYRHEEDRALFLAMVDEIDRKYKAEYNAWSGRQAAEHLANWDRNINAIRAKVMDYAQFSRQVGHGTHQVSGEHLQLALLHLDPEKMVTLNGARSKVADVIDSLNPIKEESVTVELSDGEVAEIRTTSRPEARSDEPGISGRAEPTPSPDRSELRKTAPSKQVQSDISTAPIPSKLKLTAVKSRAGDLNTSSIFRLARPVIVVLEQTRIDTLPPEMFKELLKLAWTNNPKHFPGRGKTSDKSKLRFLIPDTDKSHAGEKVRELAKAGGDGSVSYQNSELPDSTDIPVIGFSGSEQDTLAEFQNRLGSNLARQIKDSAFRLSQPGDFGVGLLYALKDVPPDELPFNDQQFRYDASGRYTALVLEELENYAVFSTSA